MISGRAFLYPAFACAVMLSACDKSPSDDSAGPSSGVAKPAKSKAPGLAENMVMAVSAGKGAAVVSVHFALGKLPAVNEALPVDIVLVPHQEFSSLRAHFDSRDGLALTTGSDFGPESTPSVEKPLTHQLILLPSREGMSMLSVSVETESASEGTVTRIYSIPVIVSPGPQSQAPAAIAN
jgi:hypothetical protein